MMTTTVHHLVAATTLAHGGRFTWDEALMVAIPIAIFAAVLITANKRATALQAGRDDVDHGNDQSSGTIEP